MKTFTLKNPKTMGENDPKYGQAFWSYTHDSDIPVMFNLMSGEVEDGSVITCEEWVNKQSAKGTDYMRLRKVKVTGQQAVTATTKTNDELIVDMLKGLHIKVDKLLGEETHNIVAGKMAEVAAAPEKKAFAEDKAPPHTDEDVPEFDDTPINLEDIPF